MKKIKGIKSRTNISDSHQIEGSNNNKLIILCAKENDD